MDIIFAPWRYEYVNKVDSRNVCILCENPSLENDRETLIVKREKSCFAMLNLYPYSTGHLMIAPYAHISSIEDVDTSTLLEMMLLAKSCIGALREAFRPDGFNLGMNIERVAGAGIADHIHLHIVPRWAGDSNFMTVCADTRVLPLDLDEVWQRLKDALERQDSD
ncbi:MAG: HIT domain-containing protein [Actinomycetota bacterium]|nr:HIT domain-containing protein [Actinomycetota bacterium]